jgi:hypothetical protein
MLTVKLDTSTIYTRSVYVYVGNGTLTLADSAENGISKWTTQGGWAVNSTYYHSPTHSFGYANYPNNANYSLTLAQPINFSAYPIAFLNFWTEYNMENGYDFGYVEVSSNNGASWQTITAFTGNNMSWVQQSFDITSYTGAGSQVLIRFRLQSDAGLSGTGWFVDDIKITNYCGVPVGIRENNSHFPKSFGLEQNYPNPFNPMTSIKYQLPVQQFVKITVFDILGKEVTTLVNEQKNAGYYEVKFDASNLASGLYFYKIEAGTFIETKKMMLIK